MANPITPTNPSNPSNPINSDTPVNLTINQKNIDLENASLDSTNVIELLAEQPKVEVQRLAVGKVRVRKEIRSKTINLPLTLKQEVLIIEHVPSSQLANALPDTSLTPHDPNHSTNWNTWVKVENAQPTTAAKILLNGQSVDVSAQPMELVISQEFAHVQIETLLTETVRLTTTTEEHEEQIAVTLRHEELVTEHKKFDTPQVLKVEEIPTQAK